MRFAHSVGLTCSLTDFCFLMRVTLMGRSSCASPMPHSVTLTTRWRAYSFARWHYSRTGATLRVRNRPRLCENAKRNLLSKHRPSKTRCIRLFLVGYWSEDPRIRNSVEFLHSLGQNRTLASFPVPAARILRFEVNSRSSGAARLRNLKGEP